MGDGEGDDLVHVFKDDDRAEVEMWMEETMRLTTRV